MAILTMLDACGFSKWLDSRPEKVRDLILRFPPNKLYRLKSSRHRVTIVAYEERKDGTVGFRVDVRAEFNLLIFERRVFGIDADGLEEAALPRDDELLGALVE